MEKRGGRATNPVSYQSDKNWDTKGIDFDPTNDRTELSIDK